MDNAAKVRKRSVFNTLSGRFLLLTVAFVMLAEVLIFVPSVARFRADYLLPANKRLATHMLGNAVPPPLAAHVINEIRRVA